MNSESYPEQLLALRDEPVELYKIVKFSGHASSGAEAKIRISEGEVFVNGEIELRKRRKMVAGDLIAIDNTEFRLISEEQP